MAKTIDAADAELSQLRVVPVVVMDDAAHATPLADAAVAGGLSVLEVTMRTPAAPDAIKTLCGRGDLLVGAGTVMDAEQAERAIGLGVDFVVSPGLYEPVAEVCCGAGVLLIPGAVTGTEIGRALAMGLSLVKLFPADVFGGPAAIRAFAGPFPSVRFMPTGGVTMENMGDYLRHPNCAAVGGSWMTPRDAMAAGRWGEIADRCRESVGAAGKVGR